MIIANNGVKVVILVLLSLAAAQAQMNDTDTTGVADAIENSSAVNVPAVATAPPDTNVQGIWKASLGEMVVVLAMNQSGESIFGLAKYEGEEPWNAALAGSVSQGAVFLSLAAMQGEEVTATCIRAAMEGGSMKGSFIRSDSSGKASRGDFAALMISPDTSGYTPAVIAASVPLAAELVRESSGQENEADAGKGKQEPDQPKVAENRFKDVTKLAKGINPNIMPRMAPL